MFNIITPPQKNKAVIEEIANLFGLAVACIINKVEITEDVKWALHYIDNALNWVNRSVSTAKLIDQAEPAKAVEQGDKQDAEAK